MPFIEVQPLMAKSLFPFSLYYLFLFALIFNLFIQVFFFHFSNQSSAKSSIFDHLPIVKDELDV